MELVTNDVVFMGRDGRFKELAETRRFFASPSHAESKVYVDACRGLCRVLSFVSKYSTGYTIHGATAFICIFRTEILQSGLEKKWESYDIDDVCATTWGGMVILVYMSLSKDILLFA